MIDEVTLLPLTLLEDALARWNTIAEVFTGNGWVPPELGQTGPPLQRALALSDFVFQQIVRHPEMWRDLLSSGDLFNAYGPEVIPQRLNAAVEARLGRPAVVWRPGVDGVNPEIDPAADRPAVMQAMRAFRRREMVRIAIRDICGWADLQETLTDLSCLADSCIDRALGFAYAAAASQWGMPADRDGGSQQLVVLGLGKLGARELNFSSDVDLVFAYSHNGQTAGGVKRPITIEEFFVKVARDLIQLIGTPTADGFVFRVDTRLRPYGDSGPLVMNFDAIEDYYQEQGREWERYALIKARVVGGDHVAGDKLLLRLKPFVYRRYLDYGAFDSLREMKGRIALEVKNKSLEDNVKLGSGGIREIEFFGQMFQLIRGGVEPALQIRPIRQVLAVLEKKGFIAPGLGQTLDQAYVFLRTVENRLQQRADQQTHQLPAEPLARLRLAQAMGYEAWDPFIERLDRVRQQVHAHFEDLLAPVKEPVAKFEGAVGDALDGIWQGVADPARSRRMMTELGYRDPDQALREIGALRQEKFQQSMSATGRERLNRLVPLVLRAVGKARDPDLVLGRILDLLRSIQRRAAYLALMLENPDILSHLVRLTEASPWIATFLCRHPVVLDELLDPRTLYRPPLRSDLDRELTQRVVAIDPEDLEYQMETLRVFKQTQVLRVAASDITSVLPLMRVSDHLSDIAEAILDVTVKLCWQRLVAKYGAPGCRLGGSDCRLGFAVIAYGKLGGLELGYGSDLDLVFLHAARAGETTGSSRGIDNAQFFSRLGQRVLHMLTTHTGAGVLYDVDMRLRPSGDSGMLVSHVNGFEAYQKENAWTWEHQALIRARAIIGDAALRENFEAVRRRILTRRRDVGKLRAEVADMRDRLRKEYNKPTDDFFDIKHGFGGILDIEFLVQYLVLRHARRHPEIVRWTDNVRLLQSLKEAGLLDETTAFMLRRAYLIYRAMVHRLALARQPAQVPNHRFMAARKFVTQVWNAFF
jgi:glutamate-ammonia-ligase adenylyltransferase